MLFSNIFVEADSVLSKEKNTYFMAISAETGFLFDVSNMSNLFQHKNAGKEAINESYYHGYSLKIDINSKKHKEYASLYRFSKYGLGFYFGYFNNRNIGYPLAVFGWTEIPIRYLKSKHKFSFGYGAEFGIAWNFNIYNEITNPTNIFLGSKENYILGAYIYADYHITNYLFLGIGAGFRHFSNGGWKQPNIGINIFTTSLSLKGRLNSSFLEQSERLQLPKYTPQWKWGGKIAFGKKQNGLNTPHYYKILAGFTLLRQFSYKHSVGAGVETTFSIGTMDDGRSRVKWKDIASPSVIGCWEWILSSKFVVPMDIGVYLLPKNIANGEKYQTYARIGVRYYLSPRFWAGLTVKGHSTVIHTAADFSELGIGFSN